MVRSGLAIVLAAAVATTCCSSVSLPGWIDVPPVKLLAVGSVATRYPAAGNVASGGYRTNIENGFVRSIFQ